MPFGAANIAGVGGRVSGVAIEEGAGQRLCRVTGRGRGQRPRRDNYSISHTVGRLILH